MSTFSKIYLTLWIFILSGFAYLVFSDISLPYSLYDDSKQEEYIPVVIYDKKIYPECDFNSCDSDYIITILNQNFKQVDISVSISVYDRAIKNDYIKFKRHIVENKI